MKKGDPSTIPKKQHISTHSRPLLRANFHGHNETTGCLIQALVEPPDYVRIYLPGEKLPSQLRPLCRTHRLELHQPSEKMEQGDSQHPLIYRFTPFPGLIVLIEPLEPAFFIKTENSEHRTTRDENKRLVLL
jgi:hypothetical protein